THKKMSPWTSTVSASNWRLSLPILKVHCRQRELIMKAMTSSTAPSESLDNGESITVRTAKPVAVTVDGEVKTMNSTALTVEDLLGTMDGVLPGAAVLAGNQEADADEKIT